jgi:hypothetical protein
VAAGLDTFGGIGAVGMVLVRTRGNGKRAGSKVCARPDGRQGILLGPHTGGMTHHAERGVGSGMGSGNQGLSSQGKNGGSAGGGRRRGSRSCWCGRSN